MKGISKFFFLSTFNKFTSVTTYQIPPPVWPLTYEQVTSKKLLTFATITCVQCGAEQAREDERAEPPDGGGDWGSVRQVGH